MRRLLLVIVLVMLTGCKAPNPTVSPLHLPTRVHPTPTPTPIDPRPYYEAGLASQEAGDTEGALRSFTWAIEVAPDFAEAYVARGTVYMAQGRIDLALADAGAALEADPKNASAHALRGEALRLLGWARQATEAFDQAVTLDPTLKQETFHSRWLAALTARDADHLMALSREYGDAHPSDPLRYYYRGWALTEWGSTLVAINTLIEGIEATPNPPALLWFALGHAYAEDRSWQEALTCFETVRTLVEVGDASLSLHSDQPIADLFGALGRAYLGVGRCVDAETMLQYAIDVGASASEYATALDEARLCQTPVPTTTPSP
jgi:tetratricopeptide (TPR) repeat protein